MSILDAPAITKNQADFRYSRNQCPQRINSRPGQVSLKASTFGNSIIAGVSGISFTDQALWELNPRLLWIKNGGIAGNTSAMMLSRVNQDVPSDSEVCFVMEGSNDGLQNVTVTQHRQNMEAIIVNLIGRGITPILVATAPLTTKSILVSGYLAAQYALAYKYNISIYDPWLDVVDKTTGDWITGLTIDSVHPTFPAGITAKDSLVALVNEAEDQRGFSPRSNNAGSPGYCISGGNCLMLSDANSDGVADGWALAGNARGDIVTSPSPFIGNMSRITSTGTTGNPYLYKTITSGWQPNDDLLVSCVVDMNAGQNPQQTFLTIRFDGIEIPLINGYVSTMSARRMYFKIKPKTTQQIQMYLKVNGAGTGSYLSIGEFEIYNMTALLSR